MVNPTFLVNVVVNDDQEIIAAFAGNWITAHQAACDLVDRMYGVPAREKTPLVIASAGGFPKDLNFYQTIKTLSNALGNGLGSLKPLVLPALERAGIDPRARGETLSCADFARLSDALSGLLTEN